MRDKRSFKKRLFQFSVSPAIFRPLKSAKTHKITIIDKRVVFRLCVRSSIDRKDDNAFGESQKSSTNRRIHCVNVYRKTFPYFRSWFVKKKNDRSVKKVPEKMKANATRANKYNIMRIRSWTGYLLSETLNSIFLRMSQWLWKTAKSLVFFYSRVLVLLRMYEQTFISFEYGDFHNFHNSHIENFRGKLLSNIK